MYKDSIYTWTLYRRIVLRVYCIVFIGLSNLIGLKINRNPNNVRVQRFINDFKRNKFVWGNRIHPFSFVWRLKKKKKILFEFFALCKFYPGLVMNNLLFLFLASFLHVDTITIQTGMDSESCGCQTLLSSTHKLYTFIYSYIV